MASIDGKAEAVSVLKSSDKLKSFTKIALSEQLINGVIAAEKSEMGYTEWAWEGMGFEAGAGGLGPGQMYASAHDDVKKTLPGDLDRFISAVNAARESEGEPAVALSDDWAKNVKNEALSNFFILAYLAICIDRSQKNGRSSYDALCYGIAIFHGARATVTAIQKKVDPDKFAQDAAIPWKDVENYIKKSGTSKEKMLLDYMYAVISGGITK